MKTENDFRDTLYTVDKQGRRKWVYPHFAPGRFFKRRSVVAYTLMLFYLSLPWITIHGKQGVLIDIPNRRFIFFGVELWATDTIFLFFTLATLAMSLFIFTSILGRVWCGWACPETVFLEFLFRPIERLIEGSDSARRKLDKAPWTASKISKKLLKHACCGAASWIIASTALAYVIGREPLIEMMKHSPLENSGPFLATLFVMLIMAFQFGWFREQFCTVLCPYARFQSVLMDQHSFLVGYDSTRGEPRGKVRLREAEQKGDCVDCGMCVRVCPTGIDIRNGTQLECVACAACVDACDTIMDEVGRPRGLIRYDTEARLLGKSAHWVRPRIFVYAAILVILCSTFAYKLSHRALVDVEIVRTSDSRFLAEKEGDLISNQFSLRLANKGETSLTFQIKIRDRSPIETVSPLQFVELQAGQSQQVPIFFRAPRSIFQNGQKRILIDIADSSGGITRRELTLFGPDS